MILFFRMGDFYETFDDDAKLTSEVLDIALTSREMGQGNRIPMAGIPYHSADGYLSRLLSAGHKVAIAEQVSEPTGKGIVDRRVTSIVTPGTVTNPELITGADNRFICAIYREGSQCGIAFADASTGEFATTTLTASNELELYSQISQEIQRLRPAEILNSGEDIMSIIPDGMTISTVPDRAWRIDNARELLLTHFDVSSLEPFGCERSPFSIRAAGALLAYLQATQLNNLNQITSLYSYSTEGFMSLDEQTRRNLEIDQSSSRNASSTLFSTLDATLTALGKRRLHRWLSQPLIDEIEISERYDGVEWFAEQTIPRTQIRAQLKGIADIERIINRVVNRQSGPRELYRLGESLRKIPALQSLLDIENRPASFGNVEPLPDISHEISAAIAEDPPVQIGSGQAIRAGYSAELDTIRETLRADRKYIASLEAREREQTGIKNIKVGFNKVFGYYLEISKANREPIPDHYIRKQTLVNAERYITPELKEAEQRVAAAEERIAIAEQEAFSRVLDIVAASTLEIRDLAVSIGSIDVLAGLGEVASARGYVRPKITGGDVLEIEGGRHPIVERQLSGGSFISNDVRFGTKAGKIAIVTGPNMAGKSTFLRQVALIVLMAQIGSFVPARQMRFNIVDRIFTRIGAQDDLASGQSTFMVEMLETATILNHASPRSLIILDEIGRGTSTYDGLAIATSIVEYIHNTPQLGCKTLFATHYHELTSLANILPGVRNYRVDVLESGDQITFLYRVVPGGADRSYGIYVAQLAGMPRAVVKRAEDILVNLEQNTTSGDRNRQRGVIAKPSVDSLQLTLFGENHPALEMLNNLEVEALTPLDAITTLYEMKSLLSDSAPQQSNGRR